MEEAEKQMYFLDPRLKLVQLILQTGVVGLLRQKRGFCKPSLLH